MLSKEDFKSAGYEIGLNCEQSAIDRAEADVMRAYINPITSAGTQTADTCIVRKALLDLTFTLLCQRSAHVTRAGAKIKTTVQSIQAQAWDVIGEMGGICSASIDELKRSAGVTECTKIAIDDICKIYFKTNFFCN